eukprot:TRINITY_DN707_c0_g1_i2.p1 TRINITY_DN707_c0_g1~~TRINITY_DN707_c0_g1_i2.p1  ORF type:complete len:100 (+),score=15.02 TRINITY_DN707_c0_g1_i2:402-701(+)
MCLDEDAQVTPEEAIWGLLTALAVMGLVFLACALWVVFNPSRKDRLFLEKDPSVLSRNDEMENAHSYPTVHSLYEFTKSHHKHQFGILYPSDLKTVNKV